MIETKIVNRSPVIVHHRVKDAVRVAEAEAGVVDAMSVVRQAAGLAEKIHLILDMRGYEFDNLDSHKIWATKFAWNSRLHDYLGRVAAVGDPEAKFFAEKGAMESDRLKFFIDINRALEWLRNPKTETLE